MWSAGRLLRCRTIARPQTLPAKFTRERTKSQTERRTKHGRGTRGRAQVAIAPNRRLRQLGMESDDALLRRRCRRTACSRHRRIWSSRQGASYGGTSMGRPRNRQFREPWSSRRTLEPVINERWRHLGISPIVREQDIRGTSETKLQQVTSRQHEGTSDGREFTGAPTKTIVVRLERAIYTGLCLRVK